MKKLYKNCLKKIEENRLAVNGKPLELKTIPTSYGWSGAWGLSLKFFWALKRVSIFFHDSLGNDYLVELDAWDGTVYLNLPSGHRDVFDTDIR